MKNPVDKLIVTNGGALRSKYQSAGEKGVRAALSNLIAADHARGLRTQVLDLDDPAQMNIVNGTAVALATDPAQNKAAIDAAFTHHAPDYLMILGAPDVVPHQDLNNLLVSNDDPDAIVFSDLPYACSAPYSNTISDFLSPTRVVGRLPDLMAATTPDYLIKLIDFAARAVARAPASYHRFFGVSAEVWNVSTNMSLRAILGKAFSCSSVPPAAPPWSPTSMRRLSHFINCHGAAASSQFYGQSIAQPSSYPVALDASALKGQIVAGTVVAAEACYGAELFDPALTGGQMGIANGYLDNGAHGMFGSTTIAYGPASANDFADLLCQYFFVDVLAGGSLGRATLVARQRYIARKSTMTPVDPSRSRNSCCWEIRPSIRLPRRRRKAKSSSPRKGRNSSRSTPARPRIEGSGVARTARPWRSTEWHWAIPSVSRPAAWTP